MVLTRLSKIRLNVTLDSPMHVLHYYQETGKTMLINGGCLRETSWPITEHTGSHVIRIRMTSALWEWKWWIKITVMSKIEWNLWNDHLINLWLARRKSGRIFTTTVTKLTLLIAENITMDKWTFTLKFCIEHGDFTRWKQWSYRRERLRDQVFGQVCNITSNIATVKKVESNGV